MSHEISSSRRSFLKKTAGAVSATALSAGISPQTHAAVQKGDKPLNVGAFGLDYTFWGI